MILNKTVNVIVTKNKRKYWMEKGYTNLHPGNSISVKIEDVPTWYRNIIVDCKCDNCGKVKQLEWRRVSFKSTHICYDCNQVKTCAHMNKVHPRIHPKGPDHHNWNPDRKICRQFYEYSKLVRKITEQNYTKYKEQINPDSHPRTKCGVEGGYQLDHKISVKWGFTHGANPKFIGSLDNLQMLSWKDNLLKGE